EDKILNTILPIAKKYGAAVIGLTLDEKGIPSTAEGRFKIAEKIVKRAKEYGIDKEDIYIDCLTLTVAAQQKEVGQTLQAIRLVKRGLGVKTVLGVSNISFGLPNRQLINRVFFAAALYEGLDLPIIDPLDKEMMDTILASNILWNKDLAGKYYLENYRDQDLNIENKDKGNKYSLSEIIIKGMKDEANHATKTLLLEKEPLEIVNEYLIPALDTVGERYEEGSIFLPQLIQSAETVKSSFEVLKEKLSMDS